MSKAKLPDNFNSNQYRKNMKEWYELVRDISNLYIIDSQQANTICMEAIEEISRTIKALNSMYNSEIVIVHLKENGLCY